MSNLELFIIGLIIFCLGLLGGYVMGLTKANNDWIKYINKGDRK